MSTCQDFVDQMPKPVRAIIAKLDGDQSYSELTQMVAELERHGYTFDFYLDAEPYDLRMTLDAEFQEWIDGGNVMVKDGLYCTQDAQYKNRIADLPSLYDYFFKNIMQ